MRISGHEKMRKRRGIRLPNDLYLEMITGARLFSQPDIIRSISNEIKRTMSIVWHVHKKYELDFQMTVDVEVYASIIYVK